MREGQKTFTARNLRKDESLAEKRLWEQLRNRTLGGHKFVRQAPAGPYVADFMCRAEKLVIEADGATHSTSTEREHDRARTRFLEAEGYRVLRFQNDEILNGMDEVLTIIRSALARYPSPPQSPCDGSPSSPASGRGHEKDLLFVFSRATGEEGDPLRSNGGDEGPLMHRIPASLAAPTAPHAGEVEEGQHP
jgi:very-short-patch-repair endonuclease